MDIFLTVSIPTQKEVIQIVVYRGAQGGFTPLVSLLLGHAAALDATGIHSLPRRRFATPTKELFEKSSLESQKLSKRIIYQSFLKVLKGGLGETSSKKFPPGAPLAPPQTQIYPFPNKTPLSA